MPILEKEISLQSQFVSSQERLSKRRTRNPEMIRERSLEKDVRADTRVALTRDSGIGEARRALNRRTARRRFPSASPVPGRVGLDKCPDTNGGSNAS